MNAAVAIRLDPQYEADLAVPRRGMPYYPGSLSPEKLRHRARNYPRGYLIDLDVALMFGQSWFAPLVHRRRNLGMDPPATLARVFTSGDRLFATVYFAGDDRWILLPLVVWLD